MGISPLIIGTANSTLQGFHGPVHATSCLHLGDLSKNNWFVALFTFGEGWHNNHHAFKFSARHGLEWWQFDMTYITIKTLEARFSFLLHSSWPCKVIVLLSANYSRYHLVSRFFLLQGLGLAWKVQLPSESQKARLAM